MQVWGKCETCRYCEKKYLHASLAKTTNFHVKNKKNYM